MILVADDRRVRGVGLAISRSLANNVTSPSKPNVLVELGELDTLSCMEFIRRSPAQRN